MCKQTPGTLNSPSKERKRAGGEGEMLAITMVAHVRERPHPNPPPEGEGTIKRPCPRRGMPPGPAVFHLHMALVAEDQGLRRRDAISLTQSGFGERAGLFSRAFPECGPRNSVWQAARTLWTRTVLPVRQGEGTLIKLWGRRGEGRTKRPCFRPSAHDRAG